MTSFEITENIIRITGIHPRKCMKCGKCSASCPAYEEMEFHPHQFASMILDGRGEELLSSRGIDRCLSCYACLERCPRGVEPAKLVEAVRVMALRRQGGTLLPFDQVSSLIDEEMPQQALMAAFRKYRK